MKKIRTPQRTIIYYVIHFDHDEYLKDVTKDELIMTISYLKAKRFDDVHKAVETAKELFSTYETEDIGEFIAIVQVTLGTVNPLLTALRRVKVIPF